MKQYFTAERWPLHFCSRDTNSFEMGATESQKTEKRPVVFLFTQRLKTYKDHNALRNRERINSPADAAL